MEVDTAASSTSLKRPHEDSKEEALVKLVAGASISEVSTAVGVCRSTVSRWWKAYREKDSVPHKKLKVTTTAEEDEELVNAVKFNKGISLKEAIEMSGFPAGEQTARKRLKDAKVKLKPKKTKKKKGKATWVWMGPEEVKQQEEWKNFLKERKRAKRQMLKDFMKMDFNSNKDKPDEKKK